MGGTWHAGTVQAGEGDDATTGPSCLPAEVTTGEDPESNPRMSVLDLPSASLDELVDAARGGSHSAFEQLVRRTHGEMFTLARRLVSDEDDAREVTQEAYLRAWRSLRSFRGDAAFTTWMHRITANCASTHLGRRRRHRHEELDDEVVVIDVHPDRDPGLATDASLLRRRVDTAIAELPPRLRAVIVLRDVYDLTHAEIAEELGISESAAKVRLHRARRRLRSTVFPGGAPVASSDDDEEVQARAV